MGNGQFMKRLKEQFGVQVFDVVLEHASSKSQVVQGALQAVNIAKNTKLDEIQQKYAREIGILRQQYQAKERELVAIDNGVFR